MFRTLLEIKGLFYTSLTTCVPLVALREILMHFADDVCISFVSRASSSLSLSLSRSREILLERGCCVAGGFQA